MEDALNRQLVTLISTLEAEVSLIGPERRSQLKSLGHAILQAFDQWGHAAVTFICTHNSRRSQLSQLWLHTLARQYSIQHLSVYSGGTEATSFNIRMVEAVRRAGFLISKMGQGENPRYLIELTPGDPRPAVFFSKTFDDPTNPESGFIAAMVCTDAEQACPVVPGAWKRYSLPYQDPKKYDDTPEESSAYDSTIKEIGREMVYLAGQLA